MKKKILLSVFSVIMVLIIGTADAAQTTKYRPHIGISGSLWENVPTGKWTCLPEQAVILLKTKSGQIWVFNFASEGKKGKKFQSLLMKKSGKEMPDFVSLDYRHVQQEKYMSWQDIKNFLQQRMPAKSWDALVKGVEEYLRREKLF